MILVSIQQKLRGLRFRHDTAAFVFRGRDNGLSSGAGTGTIQTVSCAFQRTRRASQFREGTKMIDEDRSEEISSDERRQHDRSRVIVDVHFDGGEATGVASSQDISMGGLYMSTQ